MDILTIESNKLIRDQIVVGLQNFPEFRVDTGEGFAGINLTKQKQYDCIFIGTERLDEAGLDLLENFRRQDHETDVVLVTSAKKVKAHQSTRARYDLLAILYSPIDPREFFRLVARLRRREAAGV